MISELSKYLNLSQDTVYNQFVKNGVTKDDADMMATLMMDDLKSGNDIFNTTWFIDSISNTLAALKQLRDNAALAA